MIGERIGKYRVARLLREGAVTTVYEAEVEPEGGKALIKVLNEKLGRDAEMRHRFQNEARAVAAIRHPGILQVFESGETDSGLLYLVTEYPGSESLYDRLKEKGGGLGVQVLPLFHQIAGVLMVAHEKGIIHRNLKPDSIYIEKGPHGTSGESVKLSDFGLAKLPSKPQSEEESFQTSDGTTLGTPTYMAPEIFQAAKKANEKVDVYSLGVVLYEAISGRPPFEGRTAPEILGKHLFVEPTPLAEACPGVPEALSSLVQEMLAKDGDRRPTMARVRHRLGQILGLTPRDAPAEPAPEAATSKRSHVSLLLVTLTLALLGMLGLLWMR